VDNWCSTAGRDPGRCGALTKTYRLRNARACEIEPDGGGVKLTFLLMAQACLYMVIGQSVEELTFFFLVLMIPDEITIGF